MAQSSTTIQALQSFLTRTSALDSGYRPSRKGIRAAGRRVGIVFSDLDGDTGLAILDAILAGQRDPKELVKLRHPRISKSTVAQMEAALHGDWREEHFFVLRQALDS